VVTLKELVQEIAELKKRIDVSESVLAIQAMKARYAELVDQRFERGALVDETRLANVADHIAALFTPDGSWDGGPGLGVSVGRQAIAQRLGGTTFTFSRHFFMNPRIVVDGDAAKAKWDLLSPCRRANGESYWMSGCEDDEYVRIEGTWLCRSMKLTTVFFSPVGEGWSKIFV
jgi:hypothetical protein